MATTTDVKNALATAAISPREKAVKDLIRAMEGQFAQALPAHIPLRSFLRTALSVVAGTPALAECSQRSMLAALMECARLGLEPGTEQASIIPFKRVATLVVGYQGYIELMYRSGMVESVVVDIIHENDPWAISRGKRPPDDFVHEPDLLNPNRGRPVLAYAFAWLKGGARSTVITLTRSQANHIRDHESRSGSRPDSAWQTHYDDMWIKSCVRRLRKWVPTSSDIRLLLNRADEIDSGRPLRVDVEVGLPPEEIESTAEDVTEHTAAVPGGPTAGADQPAAEVQESGTGWPEAAQPPDAEQTAQARRRAKVDGEAT